MGSWKNGVIRPRSLVAFFLTCALFWTGVLLAQQLTRPPPQVEALAAILSRTSIVDVVLRDVGFPQPPLATDSWRGWNQWPIERKLAQAVAWAERSNKGDGERLMRYAAFRLADQVDAIRDDKRLQELFPEQTPENRSRPLAEVAIPKIKWPPNAQPLEFATIEKELPTRIRTLISVFATHAYRLNGGFFAIGSFCCESVRDKIEKILYTSKSTDEVLTRFINGAATNEEKAIYLAKMTEFVISGSAAFLYDPRAAEFGDLLKGFASKDDTVVASARAAFADAIHSEFTAPSSEALNSTDRVAAVIMARPQAISNAGVKQSCGSCDRVIWNEQSRGHATTPAPFFGPDNGSAPPGSLQPGFPLPPDGGGTPRGAHAEMSYRSFLARNYPNPGGPIGGVPTFSRVRTVARGFGGVVFGSPTGAIEGLPKPKAMNWIEAPAPSGAIEGQHYGYFALEFSDGTTGRTSIWPATLAYAARAIVFGQDENGASVRTETWKEGDAIGLTSVNGDFPIDDPDSQPLFVLLHPTIADLVVAQAAVFLDVSPVILRAIGPTVDPLMEKLGGSSAREILQKWRRDLKGWYKFLDVPTLVFRDNLGVVAAMRTGPGSEKYTTDILKRAFIDTQGFRGNTPDPDSPEFYSIVPYLALLSPEIAQMNALSELLSIVRWCKLSGLARIDGKIVPARQQGPVGSIRLTSLGDGKLSISYGPPLAMMLIDKILEGQRDSKQLLIDTNSSKQLQEIDIKTAEYRSAWLKKPEFIALTETRLGGLVPPDEKRELEKLRKEIAAQYIQDSPLKSKDEMLDALLRKINPDAAKQLEGLRAEHLRLVGTRQTLSDSIDLIEEFDPTSFPSEAPNSTRKPPLAGDRRSDLASHSDLLKQLRQVITDNAPAYDKVGAMVLQELTARLRAGASDEQARSTLLVELNTQFDAANSQSEQNSAKRDLIIKKYVPQFEEWFVKQKRLEGYATVDPYWLLKSILAEP